MDITATTTLAPQQVAKARQAATDFEAFYVTQFINLMKSQNEAEQFNGGVGEKMFRQELNTQLGQAIARQGGFGIGDAVYAQLIRQQEAMNHGAR